MRETRKKLPSNREREYQMRGRGRERAVKLTLPVGEAGEFDPLCKLHSRQRNTLKKKFLKISTGIVVQTTGNTRAQLKCKIHRGLKNQAHQQIESLGWLFKGLRILEIWHFFILCIF